MGLFRKKLGGDGEQLARVYLKKNGYRILDENYATPFGELDFVGIDADALVFIEVKTRRSSRYGNPLNAITYRKRNSIIKSALYYLGQKKFQFSTYRFDTVSIEYADGTSNNIELIKNAFELNGHYSF